MNSRDARIGAPEFATNNSEEVAFIAIVLLMAWWLRR